MVKRLWTVISTVATLNVAALIGLGLFAWTHGWITRERVRAAAEMLAEGPPEPVEAMEATSKPAEATDLRMAKKQPPRDVQSAELNRREREIERGWQQLEMQQLAFLKEKESFSADAKRRAQKVTAMATSTDDEGWKREVALIGGLKAKLAKDLLMQKQEPEVVKLLSELDIRQARKIIEQCRTSEDRAWIGRILGQMQDRDAAQAEALVAGTSADQGE